MNYVSLKPQFPYFILPEAHLNHIIFLNRPLTPALLNNLTLLKILSHFSQNQNRYSSFTLAQENTTANVTDNVRNEEGLFIKEEPPIQDKSIERKKLIPFTSGSQSDLVSQNLKKDYLKKQISEIMQFFIQNFGKFSQNQIDKQRIRYAHDNTLLEVFDTLNLKYFDSAKCKEEMIRLLIRKALTFMRNNLKDELKINTKQASLALCKKFFLSASEKAINEAELDIEKEDRILDFFLPYKANSRNKTPNSRFIEEAFHSEGFSEAYLKFLFNFDEIMKKDNQKKIEKFISFVYDCIEKKAISKIKKYKRLPWLESWIESTKVLAHEILNKNTAKKVYKSKTLNNKKIFCKSNFIFEFI